MPAAASRIGRELPRNGSGARRHKYLATAAECIRLAARMSDPARKLMLLDLTAPWPRLADHADFSRRDSRYETPLSFEGAGPTQ